MSTVQHQVAAFVDRERRTTKRHASVNLVYDKKPQHYAEDNRTEFNYCVCIGKPEAEVTSNKTRAQLLPRMADRTRAVKTTLFTSALRRIFSNR